MNSSYLSITKKQYKSYYFEHLSNEYEMLNIGEDDLLDIVNQINIDLGNIK